MTRAAIYARFSSDRQNDRSIADQITVCKAWAAREGLSIVATFEDHAASGASLFGRADMQRLIAEATEKKFDVVIAESMSRIGRDEEDRAGIRKRLSFHGVRMATPADGFVSPLVDGIRAVIDSAYLDDLKRATRRGLAGVVRDGRSAGGRAYGYRPVLGFPGKLVIVAEEAEIIREIFTRYAEGQSPRAIAADLNRRAIKAPRGNRWSASTIRGNKRRGYGIVLNPLYSGTRVWNRIRMVKDPDTGRRVSRSNSAENWHRQAAPDLAIVSAVLFNAAQARSTKRGPNTKRLNRAPKRMLSGLLRCAACGGGMSIYGVDKLGHARVRCTTDGQSGSCPDPHSFRLDTIEAVVTRGLRAELKNPAVLTEYVREYHAERKRLAGSSTRRRGEIERRCGEIDRALARATDALLNGIGDAAAIDLRSKELRSDRDRLGAELAALPDTSSVIALHPAALDRYGEQIARLESAIGLTVTAGDSEAIAAIHDLVATVTVKPGDRYGQVEVEIAGRLNSLLGDLAFPNGRQLGGLMVAGEGFEPPTSGL